MILITLGTGKYEMTRLLSEIGKLIDEGVITEQVIAQIGNSSFKHSNMEIFDFIPYQELQDLVKTADVVISHGGVASVNSALKLDKKIIVVPRYAKYEEVLDDHQVEFARALANGGYVLSYLDGDNFGDTITGIFDFKPKKYHFDNTKLLGIITDYINNN